MLFNLARRIPPQIKSPLKKMLSVPLKQMNYYRRKSMAMSYYEENLRLIDEWARKDSEDSNFYYNLTPLNRDQLAQTISNVTGKNYEEISAYFAELENDKDLKTHLLNALSSSDYGKDIEINYSRRLGWYAFVRAMKPKVVLETGVDHGVGSCVLASAIIRNQIEGYPGQYFGTDINQNAGKLFKGIYSEVGQILYGDSITSLKKLDKIIDLFINDSDHSGEYEFQEYLTIHQKLSSNGIILGDNSHITDSLSRFSKITKRKFLFFSEKPENHWYPGAGIGISYL